MGKFLDLFLVYGEITGSVSQAQENKENQGCVYVFSVVTKMFIT